MGFFDGGIAVKLGRLERGAECKVLAMRWICTIALLTRLWVKIIFDVVDSMDAAIPKDCILTAWRWSI